MDSIRECTDFPSSLKSPAASLQISQAQPPSTLSEATQDEEFFVVGVKDRLETLPARFQNFTGLQLSVRQEPDRVNAAVQCDFGAPELSHIIDVKNRCIEDLQRRINMQEVEIATLKRELEMYKKKNEEKLSNIGRPCEEGYASPEHVYAQCPQTAGFKGELPSFSQNYFDRGRNQLQCYPHSFHHLNGNEHAEPAKGAAAAAPAHNDLTASTSGATGLQGAAVFFGEEESTKIMNHQRADCGEDCQNLISNLLQRMETAQGKLRDQCFEYCAASERRLRQELLAEREKMVSCFREMELLRDYVTSMTDVVETMTSSYMTKADATVSKADSGETWQCDAAKTPPAT